MWFLSALFGVPLVLVSIGTCVNLAYRSGPVPLPVHPLLKKWSSHVVEIEPVYILRRGPIAAENSSGERNELQESEDGSHQQLKIYHVQLSWTQESGWIAHTGRGLEKIPFREFIDDLRMSKKMFLFEITTNQFEIHKAIENLAKNHDLCDTSAFFSNYSVVVSSARKLLPDCLFFSGHPDFVRFQTLFSLGLPNLFKLDADGLILNLHTKTKLETIKEMRAQLLKIGKLPIFRTPKDADSLTSLRSLETDKDSPILFFL